MSSYGQPQLFELPQKKPGNHGKCHVVVNSTEIVRFLHTYEHEHYGQGRTTRKSVSNFAGEES